MAEDNYCPVCGKHFAEEEDYDNHAEQDHPEVKETYPDAFKKEDAEELDTELDVADSGHRSTYSDANYDKYHGEEQEDDKEEADEEGADDPLKKVDDLSESWSYLSTEAKANVFESLGISQGDAYTLANRNWSELTSPLRTNASEAYAKAKEQEEDEEKGEEQEEDDEDKIYESFYNLEQNHSSKDFRKKQVCENCNLVFENKEEKDSHYNDVHAPADEFELDDDEDDYKVDPLPKGEGYDGI
jgi:uncharacterized C2H2 Zn-finger protein